MIVKYHATRMTSTVRRGAEGVQRVVIARTDGLAFHDDGPEPDHETTAAVVATVLGIAESACGTSGLGGFTSAVVRGSDGCLAVFGIDDSHVLAVVTEPTANLVLLDRVARRAVAQLTGAEPGHRARHL